MILKTENQTQLRDLTKDLDHFQHKVEAAYQAINCLEHELWSRGTTLSM